MRHQHNHIEKDKLDDRRMNATNICGQLTGCPLWEYKPSTQLGQTIQINQCTSNKSSLFNNFQETKGDPQEVSIIKFNKQIHFTTLI